VPGSLFRTKSIDRLIADARVGDAGPEAENVATSAGEHSLQHQAVGEHTLRRTLGPLSLVSLGIGGIIGAGIFVRPPAAISERSGP
jgi:amino acid permease